MVRCLAELFLLETTLNSSSTPFSNLPERIDINVNEQSGSQEPIICFCKRLLSCDYINFLVMLFADEVDKALSIS